MSDRPGNEHDGGFASDDLDHTAQRVRNALIEHTDNVEIQYDAYTRLANRVAEKSRGAGSWKRSWLPSPGIVVAGVAAVAVLVGGVAVLGQTAGDEQNLSSADGPATNEPTIPYSSPPSTSPPASAETTGSTVADPATEGARDRGSGETIGPVRSTKRGAAEAFLQLLDVRPAEVVDAGGEMIIRTVSEGGTQFDREIATLELIEVNGDGAGWAVTGATGSMVSIEDPLAETVLNDAGLTITGIGTGFENSVDVEVRSAVDGSQLFESGTSAGNLGEPGPFELTVDLVGTEHVWVVVRSSTGADGVAQPFAAVPITINSVADPAVYVVTGVPLDDPDGGLNLRAGPGPSEEKLSVLPWGQGVNRTKGAFPTRVGQAVWWPVTTTGGTEGWVNAGFLAGSGSLSTDELNTGAQTFMFAAAQPEIVGSWYPVSDRLGFTVVADGETVELPDARLRDQDGWTDPVVGTASLAELVSAPGALATEMVLTPNSGNFDDPAMVDVATRYFADLPYVTATYNGSDGRPHATHLFFETTPVGPRYIGAILE